MVRNITRRCITREQREHFDQFINETQPSDDQQIEYLRIQFPNFHLAHIFQLFEILNSRRHRQQINFENLINFIRLRNQRNERQRMNVLNHQEPVANDPVGNNNNNNNEGNNGGNPEFVPVINAPPVAPPLMAAQPHHLIFVDDPFKGNINPGTSEGAKLYIKATAKIDEDDKIDININNSQKFLDRMTRDTNTFGWGMLVRTVQVNENTQKNILKDHKDISAADIKRQAYKTWGNHAADFHTPVPDTYNLEHINPEQIPAHREIFYRRVRSRMIAKRIIAYLKTSDFEVLKNKAHQITWSGNGEEEIDGPTILWILLKICNPSTRVGVAELKEDLRKTTSAKFQHNVKLMTDHLSSKYRNIQEKGQTHEDYLLDVFNALASVPNQDFAAHIRDERREWELGGTKTADELISESVTIYNNAVSAGRWEAKDPKDAKILALTTRLEELEKHNQLMALTT